MAAEQTEDFFGPVAVDDLQTGDPLKQIPALSKLIYSAGRGKDVTHYFDLVAKVRYFRASEPCTTIFFGLTGLFSRLHLFLLQINL